MPTNNKTFLLFFFLLISNIIVCQEKKELISIQQEIISKSTLHNKDENFKKILELYLNKEWDSILFNTTNQIETNSKLNKETKQYYYFFKGYGLYKKKKFKSAKETFQKITPPFLLLIQVKSYLGELALLENNYSNALTIFKEVESELNSSIKGIEIRNIKHNIGICYLHLKKFKEAEKYLTNSIQLYEKEKDSTELVGAYGDIATLYYEQYKDDLAIPYFKKAYEFSKTVDNFTLKSNTAKNMAVVEENRKDITAALKYRKEYEQWNDSLNNHNKIWELAQLEKKLAVEKKQIEVNLLKAENKAKIAERNSFLYITMALSILLLVIIVFYRKNIKSKRTILAQKEQLDTLNETKDRLFSIVSHDLRSSVNTLKLSNKKVIKNLEKENIKNAHKILQRNSTIVSSAYNLLDNLLNWAMLQTQQSYFEIEENHLYFTVEHVVYNYIPLLKEKELQLKNSVDKTTKVMADQESLKIILRNLLDNAIKFSDSEGDIKIYTQDKDASFLDIVIEDSGIGMDVSTREKLVTKNITVDKRKHTNRIGSGLGLQLCKSMIQKNKGKLSIESELGKGTKMIVSLPKLLING
ncbi:tetratricopeptide repeat-containing sensor histidine kinase [Tenacibaculum sp. M341]|uniref:tetratricopeptide repeat-containing sensor histidine kinase n=1 Tax=Tenacibaculum sp. M341 TaxID=2530339 RepID=UPI00104473B1|nr:tetratricopeptide repeat-containing sensor histidine kinase [Tenacibaculum sp. M341]TCI84441.1 sensor histidine kinase [Tenacibaculum sp. M341]